MVRRMSQFFIELPDRQVTIWAEPTVIDFCAAQQRRYAAELVAGNGQHLVEERLKHLLLQFG